VIGSSVSSPRSEPLVVDLAGELTIRTIAEAHARLLAALETHSAVTARVDAEATVDLTFIQLIESARHTARAAEASFSLAAPAQGGLLEALHRGGFTQTADQRAFWLEQSGDQ
jgi:hypothetical protein